MKETDRAASGQAQGAQRSAAQRKKEEKRWPSKQTMNLYVRRRTMMHPTRLIPILTVIVLMAAALGKFGVADRLARVEAERAALAVQKQELAQLQESIADFDTIRQQYSRYSYNGYDRTLRDRLELLDLLEQEVFPHCTVRQFSVTGQMMTLTLSNLTLSSGSELVGRLEAHSDIVEAVFVSNASFDKAGAAESDEQVVQMSVLLRNAQEGGKG